MSSLDIYVQEPAVSFKFRASLSGLLSLSWSVAVIGHYGREKAPFVVLRRYHVFGSTRCRRPPDEAFRSPETAFLWPPSYLRRPLWSTSQALPLRESDLRRGRDTYLEKRKEKKIRFLSYSQMFYTLYTKAEMVWKRESSMAREQRRE